MLTSYFVGVKIGKGPNKREIAKLVLWPYVDIVSVSRKTHKEEEYADSVAPGQPVHPHCPFRSNTVRSLVNCILCYGQCSSRNPFIVTNFDHKLHRS